MLVTKTCNDVEFLFLLNRLLEENHKVTIEYDDGPDKNIKYASIFIEEKFAYFITIEIVKY